MKQGTLNSRIILLALLGAVVLYLCVSAWRSFRDPFSTVVSYAYTVDDSLEATGFLVREEQVLTASGGVVELIPEEGEKVARGSTVALLYQDASGLEQTQQLQALELEREQLEYALERSSVGGGDSSQLSRQVIKAIAGLRWSAASGELTGLESQAMELKSLVYKREYTFSDSGEATDAAAAIQDSLEQVEAEISQLTALAAQRTSRVTAGAAGVFSGVVDGYESLLTPETLGTLTTEQLSQLSSARPAADSAAIGKLITDTTWYFACAMDQEEADRLVEGRQVTVRFSRDWSGEVEMTVERLGDPDESGQAVVVLSSTRFLSDTTLLRRQTVELVFDTVTGIRVPNEAIRVEQQTVTDSETGEESTVSVTGVYVLVGRQSEFKPVTILSQQEDFVLVESAPLPETSTAKQQSKTLRAGDEVILAAEELYDGKVVR